LHCSTEKFNLNWMVQRISFEAAKIDSRGSKTTR
jgi:hypothetical protein